MSRPWKLFRLAAIILGLQIQIVVLVESVHHPGTGTEIHLSGFARLERQVHGGPGPIIAQVADESVYRGVVSPVTVDTLKGALDRGDLDAIAHPRFHLGSVGLYWRAPCTSRATADRQHPHNLLFPRQGIARLEPFVKIGQGAKPPNLGPPHQTRPSPDIARAC